MIRRLHTWQTWAARGIIWRLTPGGELRALTRPDVATSATAQAWFADLTAELLLAHTAPMAVPWNDAVAGAVWRQVCEGLADINADAIARWGRCHVPDRWQAAQADAAAMQGAAQAQDLPALASAARAWQQRVRHLAGLQALAARRQGTKGDRPPSRRPADCIGRGTVDRPGGCA